MNFFFDTSALVKLFHEERGTEEVTELVEQHRGNLWCSALAQVELTSALYKKRRIGDLTKDQLSVALTGVNTELRRFHLEPVGEPVISEAIDLIRRYGASPGLRTLDALHLASFHLIADSLWTMVASDNILCRTARAESYNVVNPGAREDAS